MRFKSWQRLLIRMRCRRWIGPAICAIPYVSSVIWLFKFSQVWIALVLLVPALLMVVLCALTWVLARLEFYGHLRRR